MRPATMILAAFLAAAPTVRAAGDLPAGTNGGLQTTRLLPAALRGYYPPAVEQPVYLFAMVGLEHAFSGIVADLLEDDPEGARGSFAEFRNRYAATADMIPEWKEAFPTDPVEKLRAALAAGDRTAAVAAVGELGEVCHRCHFATMVPVQQKYRWGNMGALTVKDPLSGEATGYSRFKGFLAANLAGITVDLRQGQTENARAQFQGFRARFLALAATCQGCHDGRIRHYVDREVQETVDAIGAAFAGRDVNPDEVSALVRKLGGESCSKCHLVHLPAAHATGPSR